MQIHQRFKEIRKTLKMTQTEFGEQLDKTMRAIQNYEAGERSLNNDIIMMLNEKFNINIHWLYTGFGNMFLSDNENKADSGFVSIAPTYDLPERFLQLCCKLKKEDFIRVEGYIQAIVDSYKNKDMQKLSS